MSVWSEERKQKHRDIMNTPEVKENNLRATKLAMLRPEVQLNIKTRGIKHRGYKFDKKTITKMRQAHLGVAKPLEQREKIRASMIGKNVGKIPWNKNKHNIYSQETLNKKSQSMKGKVLGRIPWNKGKTKATDQRLKWAGIKGSRIRTGTRVSESTKNKISNTLTKKIASGEIKVAPQTCKHGVRNDLGHYCRSMFEANYCRFLKYNNIKYEYETTKCIFKLSNGRNYICDLYLPETNQYIELKGWLRDEDKIKYNLFQQDYPFINWKIILQDSIEWKNIVNQYNNKIVDWEKYKRDRVKWEAIVCH